MGKIRLKKFLALFMVATILISPINILADSSKVVTLGADLTEEQRQLMLKYFGVKENEVAIIEVNNQDERKYLEGVATEQQIGTRTYSCIYIQPTNSGVINIKTANINWVTSSMLCNTLMTAGISSCDVIAASPIEVSGTGALTGVMKAYETVTGEELDEEKKEIATEELITTTSVADEVGQDKATLIINNVKEEIIKDRITDEEEIKKIVNNIASENDIQMSSESAEKVVSVMKKISEQDYNYDDIASTFQKVSNSLSNIKDDIVEKVEENKGFFQKIGNFFKKIFNAIVNFFKSDDKKEKEKDKVQTPVENTVSDDSILNGTDESILGVKEEGDGAEPSDDTENQQQNEDNSDLEQLEKNSVTDSYTPEDDNVNNTSDNQNIDNTIDNQDNILDDLNISNTIDNQDVNDILID